MVEPAAFAEAAGLVDLDEEAQPATVKAANKVNARVCFKGHRLSGQG